MHSCKIPFFRDLASCPGVGVVNPLISHLYDSLNFDIPFVCLFGHLHRKESGYPIFQGFSLTSRVGIANPIHPKQARSILTPHNSCNLIPQMYGSWQRENFCPRYRYILSYIAYTQDWTRTCSSRGKTLASSDHGYENLTDVPLRSVFFNSSPL